jgi:O-antigen/teichoic acid export membrane protein
MSLIRRYYFKISISLKNIDIKKWYMMVKEAIPLGIITIVSLIYFRIDVLMLSWFIGNNATTGLYVASTGIITALLFIPYLLAQSVYPVFSASHKMKWDALSGILKDNMRTSFYISAILAIILIIFSSQILSVAYGRQYLGASLSLKILGVFFVLTCVNIMQKSFLTALKKQRIVLITIIIGVVINILMNLYFIPHYSLVGASITTLISEIITFIILRIEISRLGKTWLR